MSDRTPEVEAALERLFEAARAHLAAVAAAGGAPDDDGVWRAYVALNNAAYDYDRVLNDAFDEVTPFDVEKIVDDVALDPTYASSLVSLPARPAGDAHPHVISVRQRRDYRVPSVAALLSAAVQSRPYPAGPGSGSPEAAGSDTPVGSVGDAIVELLEAGDGSLAMLDLPELEPLDGVVVVVEVDAPLSPEVLATMETEDQPFRLVTHDTVIARLHEQAPTDDE